MDLEFPYEGPPVSRNQSIVRELAAAKERLRKRRSQLYAKTDAYKTPSLTRGEMIAKGVRGAFAEIEFGSEAPAIRHALYLCDKLSAAAKADCLRSGDGELAFVRRLVEAI